MLMLCHLIRWTSVSIHTFCDERVSRLSSRSFEKKFEERGLKVYLCRFTCKDGEFWWFMFEDVAAAGGAARGKKAVDGALWKEYGTDKNLGGSW